MCWIHYLLLGWLQVVYTSAAYMLYTCSYVCNLKASLKCNIAKSSKIKKNIRK